MADVERQCPRCRGHLNWNMLGQASCPACGPKVALGPYHARCPQCVSCAGPMSYSGLTGMYTCKFCAATVRLIDVHEHNYPFECPDCKNLLTWKHAEAVWACEHCNKGFSTLAARPKPPPECPCGGPKGHVPGGIHCRKT